MWTEISLYGNKSPPHPIYSSHQVRVPLSQYLFTCLLIRLFILTITHSYGQQRLLMADQWVLMAVQWVPMVAVPSSGNLRHPTASSICSRHHQEIFGRTGSKYASQHKERYVDITPSCRRCTVMLCSDPLCVVSVHIQVRFWLFWPCDGSVHITAQWVEKEK